MIKQILLTVALALGGFSASAQFSTYHSLNESQEAQAVPTQTIYGYRYTTNGWVRISLCVKETSTSILVVGYKEKDTSTYGGLFSTYGNSNPWRSCQAWAEEVSPYLDGREIANNFDYKASISGVGTVYF